MGDYPAPSFFTINSESGEITVNADLKTDSLKSTDYTVGSNFAFTSNGILGHLEENYRMLIFVVVQLRVLAFDDLYLDQVATATVSVKVTRNENAPRFSKSEYTKSLAENHRLGSSVLEVTATDADNVSIGPIPCVVCCANNVTSGPILYVVCHADNISVGPILYVVCQCLQWN